MRYLVKAQIKPGREADLLRAIGDRTLGLGSVAGDEYLRNMGQARLLADGGTTWVEVCYCTEPLEEELPYWQEYFDEIVIKDAHARSKCRDLNGTEAWACSDCDCTERLEDQMKLWGAPFLVALNHNFANE
jgi:hypothetical protein